MPTRGAPCEIAAQRLIGIPPLRTRPILRPTLEEALHERHRRGRPVRIGLVGCGQMGTDILVQTSLMRGIIVVACAATRPENVAAAVAMGDTAHRPRVVSGVTEARQAIRRGELAALTGIGTLCQIPEVDVVIDATGRPNAGAEVATAAIAAGKHMVMMNVEADITIGAWLAAQARRKGVVYTLGAGDEPSTTMEIIRFARTLGYGIVAAGKGKNNAFRIDAVPDDYRAEAAARNMNPRMLVEFVDGSKTAVEMTCIGNAAGLSPDVPGMHGPAAPLHELQNYFRPKAEGGLLSRKGVVDFSIAKGVAPGVFVVVEAPHPRIIERFDDLHVGKGPYYALTKPYHLTSLEVPLTAAAAVLFGTTEMVSLPVPSGEVGCMTKRDIEPGETLDAIGETCYRGFALERADAVRKDALPIGLAHGAKVVERIPKGALITRAAAIPDKSLMIVALRRKQDAMVARLTAR
ncbi:MAG: homoserine dehydrogenase [Methylocystis sp.]|nr:homoserine dehydrogenase [Methylocystis sp.]MCA3582568.1 homoserine dehydrogenase [Methylocystis sp.]MCA3586835.1 homoserine dehydrogenase [Methylocystis sp.]MCA3591759.1 homoserine dehydrogenase [Methylocystis sp.]